MTDRVTTAEIRLIGNYDALYAKADGAAAEKDSDREACRFATAAASGEGTVAGIIEAGILPETERAVDAYTLAANKSFFSSVHIEDVKYALLGATIGYAGLVKCIGGAANEYTATCAGRSASMSAAVRGGLAALPDKFGDIRRDVQTRCEKSAARLGKEARRAGHQLQQKRESLQSGFSRNTAQVKGQVTAAGATLRDFGAHSKNHLYHNVFTRKNAAVAASAGALSVLSLAFYKSGTDVPGGEGEENTYNGASVNIRHVAAPVQRPVFHHNIYREVSPRALEAAERVARAMAEHMEAPAGTAAAGGSYETAERERTRNWLDETVMITHIPLADSFRISSNYGPRLHPVTGRRNKMHYGIDIAAPVNTPVESPARGIVRFAGVQRGYGKVVIIDHENGVETLYAHLNGFSVGRGQRVERGQNFARVGATGRVTGAHLHFEIRENGEKVNPGQYVRNQRAIMEARPGRQ